MGCSARRAIFHRTSSCQRSLAHRNILSEFEGHCGVDENAPGRLSTSGGCAEAEEDTHGHTQRLIY